MYSKNRFVWRRHSEGETNSELSFFFIPAKQQHPLPLLFYMRIQKIQTWILQERNGCTGRPSSFVGLGRVGGRRSGSRVGVEGRRWKKNALARPWRLAASGAHNASGAAPSGRARVALLCVNLIIYLLMKNSYGSCWKSYWSDKNRRKCREMNLLYTEKRRIGLLLWLEVLMIKIWLFQLSC